MLLHLLQICSLSLSVLFCQSSTWPSSLSTFSFPLIIHPYISSPCSLTGALPLSIYCHCFEMMPNCQCFKYFLPTSLGPLQQHPHFIFFPQKIILGRKFYERKKMFSCSCMCFSLADHIFQWCCNKKNGFPWCIKFKGLCFMQQDAFFCQHLIWISQAMTWSCCILHVIWH